ncbi:MAG: hypothetical protein II784_07120 [Oscillospiraceae bacterium]|nr:hypothetical protein [Oscillospiraceae bacterium]
MTALPGSELFTFLSDCMKENLNHARHVENEIHAFTGVYMAVVAGLLAFNLSSSDADMRFALYIVMLFAGAIALGLVHRWYKVLDNHTAAAQNIYYALADVHVNGKYPYTELDRLRELQSCRPEQRKALMAKYEKDDRLKALYVFSHPRRIDWLHTRSLVYAFHIAICIVILALFVHTIAVRLGA